jgi:hypothetical protein
MDLSLEWLNDHPDQAAELLPEVVRYLHWKSGPFYPHWDEELREHVSGHFPPRFVTRTGEEVD